MADRVVWVKLLCLRGEGAVPPVIRLLEVPLSATWDDFEQRAAKRLATDLRVPLSFELLWKDAVSGAEEHIAIEGEEDWDLARRVLFQPRQFVSMVPVYGQGPSMAREQQSSSSSASEGISPSVVEELRQKLSETIMELNQLRESHNKDVQSWKETERILNSEAEQLMLEIASLKEERKRIVAELEQERGKSVRLEAQSLSIGTMSNAPLELDNSEDDDLDLQIEEHAALDDDLNLLSTVLPAAPQTSSTTSAPAISRHTSNAYQPLRGDRIDEEIAAFFNSTECTLSLSQTADGNSTIPSGEGTVTCSRIGEGLYIINNRKFLLRMAGLRVTVKHRSQWIPFNSFMNSREFEAGGARYVAPTQASAAPTTAPSSSSPPTVFSAPNGSNPPTRLKPSRLPRSISPKS